tara:strand:+ start:97 stop:1536 length:1440 start_codon:yes stop_codon:yes gene_type:complete
MSNAMEDERSRIPNLMKIGAITTDMQMDYDTFILDPVVNTDTFSRFVLNNRGFLNSFSRIQLSVKKNASDPISDGSSLPAGVGIYSLIDRVSLRIGTEIVSEMVDFNHFMGYKSMFIDNDINLERETYLTSRITSLGLRYKEDGGGDESNVNASGYAVKTNREYTMSADGDDGDLKIQTELQNTEAAEFSVSVADLIPWLRFNQLPLYQFKEQVSIEIHYSPPTDHKRMVVPAGAGGATFEIDGTKTKFIYDTIYYDGDMMARFAAENSDMNWTYTDYRLNKRSYVTADLEKLAVLNIGGAGRLCNKVICGLEYEFATPDESILNRFVATCPTVVGGQSQVLTSNLIYNNNRLYPVDRTSPALHFHDLISTEQNVPHVSQQMYSESGNINSTGDPNDVGVLDQFTYNDKNPDSDTKGILGQFFYQGFRLNRNERVDSKGIELEINYGKLDAGQTFIHRSWIEMVKSARLKDGIFTTTLM